MSDKRYWVFLIFLFSGIIIGGLLGELASKIPFLSWLAYGKSFGLTDPLVLDINILKISFGFLVELNVASIIGILIAMLLYKKAR
ncbi:MAG: DUF4321 domain-containing protein [Clostridia bacterium]|nr:DUF4321 domain-containing protein [Clostridia bacterium]